MAATQTTSPGRYEVQMLINVSAALRPARSATRAIVADSPRSVRRAMRPVAPRMTALETVQAELDGAAWLLVDAGAGECPELTIAERAWLREPTQKAEKALEKGWFATGGNAAL